MSMFEKAVKRQSAAQASVQRKLGAARYPKFAGPHDLDIVKQVPLDRDHAFKNRLFFEGRDDAAAAAYKMLRTQVAQRMRSYEWASVAVTSVRVGEGKSLTSINLALSLATQPGQRVFLLDLDFRRHSVAQYLGMEEHSHLLELLDGNINLTEALVQIEGNGTYCLLNNRTVPDSSELLMSAQIEQLLKTLKNTGGIVICDLPPALASDDFLAFSSVADCGLIVVSENESRRDAVAQIAERVSRSNLLGIVLNKSRDSVSTYSRYAV